MSGSTGVSIRKLILLGGSAGSFPVVRQIVAHLPPAPTETAIALCLHRLRTYRGGVVEALRAHSSWAICEPDDKEPIQPGFIYVAPADYHLLIEEDKRFSLSVDEPVHYSRPSIDVFFQSALNLKNCEVWAGLLSGANRDGAYGLYLLAQKGAYTFIQDPNYAEMPIMPRAALEYYKPMYLIPTEELPGFIAKILS
ncbi:MAG: chemotaxis protein CheB [Bacteroidia bacterium]